MPCLIVPLRGPFLTCRQLSEVLVDPKKTYHFPSQIDGQRWMGCCSKGCLWIPIFDKRPPSMETSPNLEKRISSWAFRLGCGATAAGHCIDLFGHRETTWPRHLISKLQAVLHKFSPFFEFKAPVVQEKPSRSRPNRPWELVQLLPGPSNSYDASTLLVLRVSRRVKKNKTPQGKHGNSWISRRAHQSRLRSCHQLPCEKHRITSFSAALQYHTDPYSHTIIL